MSKAKKWAALTWWSEAVLTPLSDLFYYGLPVSGPCWWHNPWKYLRNLLSRQKVDGCMEALHYAGRSSVMATLQPATLVCCLLSCPCWHKSLGTDHCFASFTTSTLSVSDTSVCSLCSEPPASWLIFNCSWSYWRDILKPMADKRLFVLYKLGFKVWSQVAFCSAKLPRLNTKGLSWHTA